MKRLTIVLLLSGCFSILKAQNFSYFSIGYNFGSYNPDSLNYVIDRYNETRNYLDEKMGQVNSFGGTSFGFGFAQDGLFFETSWVRKASKTSAWGKDATNELVQRDLKYQTTTWGTLFGVMVAERVLSVGASFDVLFTKAKTRTGLKSEINSIDYEKINADFNIGTSLFLNAFIPLGSQAAIQVRPYYQIVAIRENMYDINQSINPGSYLNDPYDIGAKLNNFGVELRLAIALSGY